jgi:hypothetical protein
LYIARKHKHTAYLNRLDLCNRGGEERNNMFAPVEAKCARKSSHQHFPSLLYVGHPIKVEDIRSCLQGIVLHHLLVKQIGYVQSILLPSLRHVLCTILNRYCHGWTGARHGKDAHQSHSMDKCAIAQKGQSKYLDKLEEVGLVALVDIGII